MPRKVSFERAEVITAALTIVDEGSIGDLTIRNLASRLDVNPMTVYRFVPSKEDLLVAVAEEVLRDPSGSGPVVPLDQWRPALETWAQWLLSRLAAHRSALPLFASEAGRLQLALTGRLPVAVLRAAGLPSADAITTAQGLVALVLGAAQLDPGRVGPESSAPLLRTSEFWDVAAAAPAAAQRALGFAIDTEARTLSLVDPGESARPEAPAAGEPAGNGTPEASFFAHNLQLMLDGIEVRLVDRTGAAAG
jgi:AcrR family transcriptional regulator